MSVVTETKRYCLDCGFDGCEYIVLVDGKWYTSSTDGTFDIIELDDFNQLINLYNQIFTSLFEKEPTLSQQYISELYKEGIVLSSPLDLSEYEMPF